MSNYQTGILDDIPAYANYLAFTLKAGKRADQVLIELCREVDGNSTVLGLGLSLIHALGSEIQGLREFPVHTGPGFDIPSTPRSLWLWLRGEDAGDVCLRRMHFEQLLAPAFQLDSSINAYRYDIGRDLSGYEDGTENPKGEDAVDAAIVSGMGKGCDGSSFVAVQKWVHDMRAFQRMDPDEQNRTIGRRVSDNEEMEDAPESAHVKRTAQEDFSPEAFIVRRSMTWDDGNKAGLVFVAFGKSLYAYNALLNRMTGKDDGITDALFHFTRPVDGSFYWCPPIKNGTPDLSAIGL